MVTPSQKSLHELLSESPLRDLEFGGEGERSPVREVEPFAVARPVATTPSKGAPKRKASDPGGS